MRQLHLGGLSIAATLTVAYVVAVAGDFPPPQGRVEYPQPFEVAVVAQDDLPSVRKVSLSASDVGDTVQLGIEWVARSAVTIEVSFTVPNDAAPQTIYQSELDEDGVGAENPRVSAFPEYYSTLTYPPIDIERLDSYQIRQSVDESDLSFKTILLDVDVPAGVSRTTLNVDLTLDEYRDWYGWSRGRSAVGLELADRRAQQSYSEYNFRASRAIAETDGTAELRYVVNYGSEVIEEVLPDPYDISNTYVTWRVDLQGADATIGAQVTVVNERGRYVIDRLTDMILLLLGAIIGVQADRLWNRKTS